MRIGKTSMLHGRRYGHLLTFVGGMIVVLFPVSTLGAGSGPQTEAELSLLPAYCQARLRAGFDSPTFGYWKRRIGPIFWHIHHYCYGQNLENRSYFERDPRKRAYLLKKAVGEFGYIEKRASPDFVLMPELLVKKGKILERLGEPDDALQAYQQAVKFNPTYRYSYMAIAALYSANNQLDQAIEILNKGLEMVPSDQAEGLRLLLKHLSERSNPAATDTDS